MTFDGPVSITQIGAKLYVVQAPFRVLWRKWDFWVKKGFRTDLTSVPQFAQSVVPQMGAHLQPAIAHDYAYAGLIPGMTRAEADRMFYDLMGEVGVRWTRRVVMYAAVRAFGRSLWRGDR